MNALFFWILAAVMVVASVMVIGQRNPMYSVLLLIVSFGALSGLYVLLDAPFVAAIQIIIYAGAIMVLFLFVVMLLNAHTEDEMVPQMMSARVLRLGALLSLVLAGEIVWGLSKISLATFGSDAGVISKISSVTTIGQALFTTYSFAFEVTSILILVAMVGAVVIAGKPRGES